MNDRFREIYRLARERERERDGCCEIKGKKELKLKRLEERECVRNYLTCEVDIK